MLTCDYKSITKQKFGNSIAENEDNFLAPSKSEVESEVLMRFAIADGATESSFSKEWSNLLVSCYKDSPFDRDKIAETVNKLSESWHSLIKVEQLPWFAQEKAKIGAFASLLGLTVDRAEHKFEAVAIGDCTLFQVRNNEVILTFPVATVDEFCNTPNLIATNRNYQTEFEKTVAYGKGSIEPADIMLLATDAMAAWIFRQWKAGERPWHHLQNILTNYRDDFERWLNNQRQANEIKNDDITLIAIAFE